MSSNAAGVGVKERARPASPGICVIIGLNIGTSLSLPRLMVLRGGVSHRETRVGSDLHRDGA